MTLERDGDTLRCGEASVRLQRMNGLLMLTDLEGDGNPAHIKLLFDFLGKAKDMFGGEPVYAALLMDNPQKDGLERMYEKLGGKVSLKMFKWETQ